MKTIHSTATGDNILQTEVCVCVCVCVCVHAHMHVHVDVNACVRVLEYICMQVLFTTWQLNLIITQQCSIFSMSLAIVK